MGLMKRAGPIMPSVSEPPDEGTVTETARLIYTTMTNVERPSPIRSLSLGKVIAVAKHLCLRALQVGGGIMQWVLSKEWTLNTEDAMHTT